MVKAIVYKAIFLMALTLSAQNFQGTATYKTTQKSNFTINPEKNTGMDAAIQEKIRERMEKMNQKTYFLNFNKNTSTYKQEQKLDNPSAGVAGNSIKVLSFGGSGDTDVYFKNLKKNTYTNLTEIQGKRFLIKDKLPKHEWELSSETKNIGQYTCYKATYSREVETKILTMGNTEGTEEKSTKETIVTTAWYTPEIPLSNGPANYQGLPGLILEVSNGKKIIVCTEIVINPKETISVKEPEKGKVISQKKFDKIRKQKTDEMMEKMKGRNGLDLGNGVNVKFGG